MININNVINVSYYTHPMLLSNNILNFHSKLSLKNFLSREWPN